jgi:hypothetical protein
MSRNVQIARLLPMQARPGDMCAGRLIVTLEIELAGILAKGSLSGMPPGA